MPSTPSISASSVKTPSIKAPSVRSVKSIGAVSSQTPSNKSAETVPDMLSLSIPAVDLDMAASWDNIFEACKTRATVEFTSAKKVVPRRPTEAQIADRLAREALSPKHTPKRPALSDVGRSISDMTLTRVVSPARSIAESIQSEPSLAMSQPLTPVTPVTLATLATPVTPVATQTGLATAGPITASTQTVSSFSVPKAMSARDWKPAPLMNLSSANSLAYKKRMLSLVPEEPRTPSTATAVGKQQQQLPPVIYQDKSRASSIYSLEEAAEEDDEDDQDDGISLGNSPSQSGGALAQLDKSLDALAALYVTRTAELDAEMNGGGGGGGGGDRRSSSASRNSKVRLSIQSTHSARSIHSVVSSVGSAASNNDKDTCSLFSLASDNTSVATPYTPRSPMMFPKAASPMAASCDVASVRGVEHGGKKGSMHESSSSLGSLHDVASKLLAGLADDELVRRYSASAPPPATEKCACTAVEPAAEAACKDAQEEEEGYDAHQLAADLYKARDFHERRSRRMRALAQLR